MGELKKFYDEDEVKIITTDKLENYSQKLGEYIKKRLQLYKKLFDVDELSPLTYVIFDDLEQFRQCYREATHREPPAYSRGTFGDTGCNVVLENIPKEGTALYYRKLAICPHEAFHIYYKKLIYQDDDKRITWFDEGMARFISGEMEYMNDEQFQKFYKKFKRNYRPINNLNERIQGNTSVPDDKIFKREGVIEGYDISYLAIRYLYETKGIKYIKELMKNNDKILEVGNTVIDEMINYYDARLQEKSEQEPEIE